MMVFFAFVLTGCSETQVDDTTVEVTTTEKEEDKTVNVVVVYDDYNSTEVTVDVLLSQVGSSDIAAMAYDEAEAFFNAHGFKVEYLNHSDIYDHGNMTASDLVDMEEFIEMDVENKTFYMRVFYKEFRVNYYDEEDNLIHSETYMYSDNIEEIYDYTRLIGDYRYDGWVSMDDTKYETMPGHDIDLLGNKVNINDFEIVFRNHLDEIIKTAYVTNEEDILSNAPSVEDVEGKVFIHWVEIELEGETYANYREYKPLYKKYVSTLDIESLEYDTYTDFHNFDEYFIVAEYIIKESALRAQIFEKEQPFNFKNIILPSYIDSLYLNSTIFTEDTAIMHGEDLNFSNDNLNYNQYLLFYDLIDEEISRTINLGNSFSLYGAGMLHDLGVEYMYLIDSKIYLLIEENGPKFAIYDINDDEYFETIDLTELYNETAYLYMSLKIDDELNFTNLDYIEIDEQRYASGVSYGNLSDLEQLNEISISNDEYFTYNLEVYNDYLFVLTET